MMFSFREIERFIWSSQPYGPSLMVFVIYISIGCMSIEIVRVYFVGVGCYPQQRCFEEPCSKTRVIREPCSKSSQSPLRFFPRVLFVSIGNFAATGPSSP